MDEQEMLKQFESDMTDLEKCAIYRRDGNTCTISCRLGNWSVSGPFGMELINEAMRYFEQYKEDGEYANLLSHIAPHKPRSEAESVGRGC
jgi:hypothetical protein